MEFIKLFCAYIVLVTSENRMPNENSDICAYHAEISSLTQNKEKKKLSTRTFYI